VEESAEAGTRCMRSCFVRLKAQIEIELRSEVWR
jgi:hypothetical protein